MNFTPSNLSRRFFIILTVLLACFQRGFSGLLPYEFADDCEIEGVVFSSANEGDASLGHLFLQGPAPEIIFQLRDVNNDTKYSRNNLVLHYSSQALYPTIVFYNSSWNFFLEIDELVQDVQDVYWRANITLSKVFCLGNIYSPGKYNFVAELGKGLNLFEVRGDVIIREAQPMLDLKFGDSVPTPFVNHQDFVVRTASCFAGIAAIVPVTNATNHPDSCCYIGVTHNYFSSSSIKWFNLLSKSSVSPDQYSICNQSSIATCSNLSIIDFALARDHLVFLTNHGIVVSQSFQEASQTGSGSKITYTQIGSVHPHIDNAFQQASLTRNHINFFYTSHCYSDFVSDGSDEICIVSNNSTANGSLVFCSVPPFTMWLEKDFINLPKTAVIQHLLHDIQRETIILLITRGVSSMVQVYRGSLQKFPTFNFPSSEIVNTLHYHLYTATIFAYGSQVWQSLDGGNSFQAVTNLNNQLVLSLSVDQFGHMFSALTSQGTIRVGKVGMHRTATVHTNITLSHFIYSQVLDSKTVLLVNTNSSTNIYHEIYNVQASSAAREEIAETLVVKFKSDMIVEFMVDCECFSPQNIGQILYSKYGGSATITKVQALQSIPLLPYKQHISAYVTSHFQESKSKLSEIKVYWSKWNASLELLTDVWNDDDFGQTIVLPSGYTFLLVNRLSQSKASCLSFIPWNADTPYYTTHQGWSMYDFRGPLSWWLKEDQCKSVLTQAVAPYSLFHHLDSTDQLELNFIVVTKKTFLKPLPRVLISHPGLFSTRSTYYKSHLNTSLNVFIKQRPLATGTSPVNIVLEDTSLFCHSTSQTITIHSGCPPSKALHCIHPSIITDHSRIYKLPYNYRPPSHRGKAIPMTRHIYNVHPQKPHFRSAYAITRETVRYKQCDGKKTREECGCELALRQSTLIEHSDCIDSVYKLSFTEKLRPKFLVSRAGKETVPLNSPFYLEELNERVDYEIIKPSNKTARETNAVIMEERKNSSIEFIGSGLYHFRVHPVKDNYTFCGLKAEFIVFIVETPLPYPVKDIVMACTAMGFAASLYVIYLIYFHGKKKLKYD